ncbi:MAG: AAA family ATPase [Planctomycetaceae bacterium]|jgi:ATP-dependent HslUV protease ATP-binding subunit HslU|nr:AAA family ATPase [Planctomycetaceae bacterium]
MELTPRQIVSELDKHIVGQNEAKRSVAIAVRNRWRRQHVEESMRKEISPKNIMMIGPTGVGKTEIARRLATLTGAPFIKVEATKYTEVGYYGRDVESMVRELVENALGIVRKGEREKVNEEAVRRANDRLVDMLLPPPSKAKRRREDDEDDNDDDEDGTEENNADSEDLSDEELVHKVRHDRNREKIRKMLEDGKMEERTVSIITETRAVPMVMGNMPGMENMEIDFQEIFEKIAPKSRSKRDLTVK